MLTKLSSFVELFGYCFKFGGLFIQKEKQATEKCECSLYDFEIY